MLETKWAEGLGKCIDPFVSPQEIAQKKEGDEGVKDKHLLSAQVILQMKSMIRWASDVVDDQKNKQRAAGSTATKETLKDFFEWLEAEKKSDKTYFERTNLKAVKQKLEQNGTAMDKTGVAAWTELEKEVKEGVPNKEPVAQDKVELMESAFRYLHANRSI